MSLLRIANSSTTAKASSDQHNPRGDTSSYMHALHGCAQQCTIDRIADNRSKFQAASVVGRVEFDIHALCERRLYAFGHPTHDATHTFILMSTDQRGPNCTRAHSCIRCASTASLVHSTRFASHSIWLVVQLGSARRPLVRRVLHCTRVRHPLSMIHSTHTRTSPHRTHL
jgi:hypothetical protein